MEVIGYKEDESAIVVLTHDEYRDLTRLQEAVYGMTANQSFVGSPLREVYTTNIGRALMAINEWVRLKFMVNEFRHGLDALDDFLNGAQA